MIEGKTLLGIIPARGGSKGVPRKNLREVGGRPMIAWGIEAAARSRYLDRTVVSTEDAEIAEVARRHGGDVPLMRPAELARDDSPLEPAILHMLDSLPDSYDYLVLMEPTVPLKSAEDIDGCISLCLARDAPACVAVSEPPQPPHWMVTLDARQRIEFVLGTETLSLRRQELPKAYTVSGAAYVARTEFYRAKRTFFDARTVGYVTPPWRSWDVDTELDLAVVNAILANRPERAG